MKIRSFRPKNRNLGGSSTGPIQRTENMRVERDTRDLRAVAQSVEERQPMPGGHDVVRIISLGGVGNVQRNMFVYEYKDDIIIIDCGVGFPEEDMPGVDLVIPDISYLKDKKSKIRGILISHGHDDHIGGLPYIWPELDVPIYTQKLTAGFIKSKFTEHKLPKDKIHALSIDDKVKLGAFEASFYAVTHSVPDSTGIVLRTPIGILIHQSDFKIDWTPVSGPVPDVGRLAGVGNEGVLYMSIDSLRVEKKGYTLSERTIEQTFKEFEETTKGKLLITTTSSNITRVQQAVNVAARSGRKLALAGRSVESNFQVARDLGYLDVPAGLVIAQEEVKRFPDEKLMIIIAGSQGQPGSALSRVANFDHKYITAKKDDTVIFSADPIPGSEVDQYALIDKLTQIGCRVNYSAMNSDLHVSGHASQEEIKLMVNLAKPKYILPIGGTFRNIRGFQDMAVTLGYKPEDIMVTRDGDVIELGRNFYRIVNQVNISNVYVDGLGVGDVGSIVLRDRTVMSEEGIVMVIVPLDKQHNRLVGNPEIISRGFVFEKAAEELIEAGLEIVKNLIDERTRPDSQAWDWKYLRAQIETNLEKFFYQETNRRPLILPVVVNL